MEGAGNLGDSSAVLTLPLPDGSIGRFRIEESPSMARELAERYAEIKSYRGQGVDDPSATMRCDLSPRGFHALVLANEGEFKIFSSSTTHFIADLTGFFAP